MKALFFALLFTSISVFAEMTAPQVSYYYGSVKILSADGRTEFKQTTSLVKRVVSVADQSIVEYQMSPDADPAKPGALFLVTMERVENSNTFTVSEEGQTFEGRLEFTGADWNFTGWKYKINMKDGNHLEGEAWIDRAGIRTNKLYLDKSDQVLAQVLEDLKPISEAEYLQRRLEILKY